MTALKFHRYSAGDHCACCCGGTLQTKRPTEKVGFYYAGTSAPEDKDDKLACSKCGWEPPEEVGR